MSCGNCGPGMTCVRCSPGDKRGEAIAKIDKALMHVHALCQGKEKWTMRVPADVERDSDLILCEALESARQLLSAPSHELPNTQKPGVLATAPQADTLESGLTGRRDGQFIAPHCPGMDKCLRVECVSRCAIHGPQYIKDVAIPMLDAIMEPCKGCGKRPIDFIEGEGAAPSSTAAPIAWAVEFEGYINRNIFDNEKAAVDLKDLMDERHGDVKKRKVVPLYRAPVSATLLRSMDNAPRDGTPFLAWVPTYYRGVGAWVVALWLPEKGMRGAGWMDNRAFAIQPSAWMPLPSAPTDGGSAT